VRAREDATDQAAAAPNHHAIVVVRRDLIARDDAPLAA